MSKQIPPIQKHMTTQPHTIEESASIQSAKDEMSKLNVRHLPVVANGTLSGVLSDRDIKLAMSLYGANSKEMTVKDIAVSHPYVVDPDTPLDEVASEMANHHYGCAIVTQNSKVVGIFTTVDACKSLVDVLNLRWHQ